MNILKLTCLHEYVCEFMFVYVYMYCMYARACVPACVCVCVRVYGCTYFVNYVGV